MHAKANGLIHPYLSRHARKRRRGLEFPPVADNDGSQFMKNLDGPWPFRFNVAGGEVGIEPAYCFSDSITHTGQGNMHQSPQTTNCRPVE